MFCTKWSSNLLNWYLWMLRAFTNTALPPLQEQSRCVWGATQLLFLSPSSPPQLYCGEVIICHGFVFWRQEYKKRLATDRQTHLPTTAQHYISFFISQTWKEVMMLHHRHVVDCVRAENQEMGIMEWFVPSFHSASLEMMEIKNKTKHRKCDFIHLWIKHIYVLHHISVCLFNGSDSVGMISVFCVKTNVWM